MCHDRIWSRHQSPKCPVRDPRLYGKVVRRYCIRIGRLVLLSEPLQATNTILSIECGKQDTTKSQAALDVTDSLQTVCCCTAIRMRQDFRHCASVNQKASPMVIVRPQVSRCTYESCSPLANQMSCMPHLIRLVYSMIRYAQDLRRCRHQTFDIHFSKSLTTDLPACGFCDNCKLDKSLIRTESFQSEVRSLCLLLDRLKDVNERVTLNKLAETWRGIGSLRMIAKVVREEHKFEVAPKRANKDVST